MSNKQALDVYRILKLNGLKLENMLNQSIQSQLNQKFFIQTFGSHNQVAAAVIRKLQNSIETISIPLNFPTKKDVANATKINIQTEEKVDLLNEKVNEILLTLEELKQLTSEGLSENG